MAKEQKRGNREIKKPKTKKKVEAPATATTPVGLTRNLSTSFQPQKKKG